MRGENSTGKQGWPARCFVAGAALTLAAFTLIACAPPESPPGLKLKPAGYSSLPGWDMDAMDGTLPAFLKTCQALAKKPADEILGPAGLGGQVSDWQAPCDAARQLGAADTATTRAFFERWFVPFIAENDTGKSGLFTGYYEAEIDAARKPDAAHRYPLYRKPKNGTSLTRAEIEAGGLQGQGLEFLWLKDPVDAFFLQVQGSGIVTLAEGGMMRIGYGGNNGHTFVAIGKLMIEEGLIEKGSASMQSIRAWLRANPARAQELMNRNPRFIFFREVKEGPVGAMGVVLTAGRSLAVDPAFVPLGAPLWLDTTWPVDHGNIRRGDPLRRLMLAQDTGSAIKGPVRGDFFWGSGEEALKFAGAMKNPGRWFLLLPVTVAARKTLDVTDIVSSLE